MGKKVKEEKILIVDDDRGVLESFEVLLAEDYPLIMATNGEDALNILEKESPPLIFLDIYMPGINGKEILADVKSRGLDSKVVVITGSSDETLKDEVINLGACDLIKKPFDVGEIQDIAKETLVK
jgi:two-component system sensor histidine kinase/response regulator